MLWSSAALESRSAPAPAPQSVPCAAHVSRGTRVRESTVDCATHKLGPDAVIEICSACFAWLYSSKSERVTPATLTNVVTDLNFKKLIDIHLRLRKGGNPTLFPDYLIALTKCTSKTPFLIVYTFITGVNHDMFSRCRVGFLPAPKLVKVMRDQGLGLDLMPEVQHQQSPWLPVANQSLENFEISANSQSRTIPTLKSIAPQPIDSKTSKLGL